MAAVTLRPTLQVPSRPVVSPREATIGLERCGRGTRIMSSEKALIHDPQLWQQRLAALPVKAYAAGDTVFAEGSKTGQLLILKSGAVSIVKSGHEIATVAEAGVVFGEISALLDQPHGADVRALEASEFHVADARTLLGQDPAALLYVTMLLARRLDGANQMFLELKSQLAAGEPAGLIDATLDKIEGFLGSIGSGFIRASAGQAGYPFA
jgi:CRP/FNR family transcriptional regulator, cyclic AMP receptor protein